MVAMLWADRLSRIPIPEEQVVEGVARAIYSTHCHPPAHKWEEASDNVRDWVRAQAREVLMYVRGLGSPSG
jgi:hypothetical protein